MKGRNPTVKEQDYIDAAVELGCIVCRLHYNEDTPATIHHIDGKTKPGAHFNAIPLCARHHQVSSPSGFYATRHSPGRRAGKVAFEEAYGTESVLLEATKRLIDESQYKTVISKQSMERAKVQD